MDFFAFGLRMYIFNGLLTVYLVYSISFESFFKKTLTYKQIDEFVKVCLVSFLAWPLILWRLTVADCLFRGHNEHDLFEARKKKASNGV